MTARSPRVLFSQPYAQRITPENLRDDDWDHAWQRGWFRMRQSLFTTHFLEFDRHFHSAVWMRVDLSRWGDDRRRNALAKRTRHLRSQFQLLDPRGADAVHEDLYRRYRESLAFQPAPTLKDLLVGDSPHSAFPTWQLDLWDGNKLVASGILDRGAQSSAGICSYFDPDYRSLSLGKELIYRKMEWCREQGQRWFYPGYIAPGAPRFDYKLQLATDALEAFSLADGDWVSFDPATQRIDPLVDIRHRLEALADLLAQSAPRPRIQNYLHLDINLNPQLRGTPLFDDPVFLDCLPGMAAYPVLVVIFDPRDGLYRLRHCRSVYRFDHGEGDPDVYDSDLLFVERELFATPDVNEMVECLAPRLGEGG